MKIQNFHFTSNFKHLPDFCSSQDAKKFKKNKKILNKYLKKRIIIYGSPRGALRFRRLSITLVLKGYMKKLIALVIVAVSLLGCQTQQQLTPEQSAIDRVLIADASYASTSTTFAQYVTSAETTNLAGCPKDFVSAFQDSIAAWKKMADIEKQMYALDRTRAIADIKTFLSEYQTNPLNAIIVLKNKWPQFEKELDKAFGQIREAFTKYTLIASTVGVAYPKASGSLLDL